MNTSESYKDVDGGKPCKRGINEMGTPWCWTCDKNWYEHLKTEKQPVAESVKPCNHQTNEYLCATCFESMHRRIAELEADSKLKFDLIMEKGNKIADLERRNAELVDTIEYLTKAVNDRVHIITDLERQLKEANKYILYAPIFKDLSNGEKALKEANEKVLVLEQQVRTNDKEIAELKWKLSDYHAREGLAKVKIEELEQQVRELMEENKALEKQIDDHICLEHQGL